MKISEMNNEKATEALIRISVPFGNLCDDEKLVQLIEDYNKLNDGKTKAINIIGKMIPHVVGYALKEHKEDLYEIIGALTEKTTDQVAKMNFKETIQVFRDSYDEILQGFFTSSKQRIKQTAEESGRG